VNLSKYLLIIYLIIIIICILFIPLFISNNTFSILLLPSEFSWPTDGYHIITCPFGPRISPTSGASTFHTGIDIGAPENCDIKSICSGKVTFTGFKGADGYTIIIENSNYKIIYGHVNPDFIVKENEIVMQGQVIGKVGPKYIYDTLNNLYHDNHGPTNGATTGPHLHLTIYYNDELIDPENVLSKISI